MPGKDPGGIIVTIVLGVVVLLWDGELQMEAAVIIGICVAVALLIWSVPATNRFSIARYDYKPFSLANLGAIFIVYLFLFGAMYFSDSDAAKVSTNVQVMLGAAGLSALAILINIIRQSNILVGAYSFALQFIAWIPLLFVVGYLSDRFGKRT